MTVCSGRLFLSDFCVILKASVSCQRAFLGSLQCVLTDIERTSGNVCPAHCCWRQPPVCTLTSSWWKRERRKYGNLWSSSALSLFQRHYIMERDTDAPGSVLWTIACLLKMPRYQGLGPVMLRRGPLHWRAHITPEIIKNTDAGSPPPKCNESGSQGLGPAS